jgi:hypothetical protein
MIRQVASRTIKLGKKSPLGAELHKFPPMVALPWTATPPMIEAESTNTG